MVSKCEIGALKQALFEENLLSNKDFKTDRGIIGYVGGVFFFAFFFTIFTMYLFESKVINLMWVNGTYILLLSGFILSLIVKSTIDSYIWKRKQQNANK